MARTYGHPDPSRNSQPSQHRNTLKVQDALRCLSNGDRSSRSQISKDDFLDFICSFPRRYKVGGVIGDRLGQWLSENKDLVRSWDREINQLRPGFFRTKEDDDRDGVELPVAGIVVKRSERGLPESYAEEGSSSRRPKARRDTSGLEDPARPAHDGQPRVRTHRRHGPGAIPRLADLEEEQFGTPLGPAITAKFPAFAGLSVEQFVLRTAQAAQHDMDRVRRWFRTQRQILDPGDALVAKFLKLEAELPRYDQFVGVAEMVAQSAKAREAGRKLKEEKETQKKRRVQDARAKTGGSALPYGMAGSDDDGAAQDYDEGTAPPRSLSPYDRMDVDGFVPSTEASTGEPADLVGDGEATGAKRTLVLASPPAVASASDMSDLSTVPNGLSTDSSRRVSVTEVSESRVTSGTSGLAEMEWDDYGERVPKGAHNPRPTSQRKRKRTQKAMESGEAGIESDG